MNTLKTCLLTLTLALAGVAVDASAADASCTTCFQLAPLSQGGQPERAAPLLAEGGYERTPQGMRADNQA
ncbi:MULTISPECIES: hypothetical protein [Pseudomonas]|uniref:hypothetical protein n=1 Tax=Pseudomonas TaxID=286 RepID=UPI000B34DB7C|nr:MULTISPECIES: hypothetical protein [Pseudomonas]PMY59849.1 hypothetical protein C1Y31_30060 [Pseudomonas sp. FW305-25]PMY61368.1 hypothetical protein C1Y32_29970 [Pseudomonas sp. FW126-L8]PNA71610.1 hypothetical protein C1Y33_29085 [Pseudomonas sp. FW305-76]